MMISNSICCSTLILARVKSLVSLNIDNLFSLAIYVYSECQGKLENTFSVSLRVVSEVSWKTTKSEGKQCCLMLARQRLGWTLIKFNHQ